MWYKFLMMGLLALTFSSCEQLEDCCTPIQKVSETENIFSSPRLGKITQFVAFKSDILYKDSRWHIVEEEYVEDTISVAIINLHQGVYTCADFYTPGSKTYAEIKANPDRDSVGYFTFEPTANGWKIGPLPGEYYLQSFLFGYSEGFELPSDSSVSALPETVHVTALGKRIENLTLSYDYSPMAYDGAGLQWYHSKDAGIVRVGFIGAMLPIGSGWDILAEEPVNR